MTERRIGDRDAELPRPGRLWDAAAVAAEAVVLGRDAVEDPEHGGHRYCGSLVRAMN